MNRRWITSAVVATVLALTLGLVGCGISAQPEATKLDPKTVPFGLLDEETTTTPADTGKPVAIYLLSEDRLVPVERKLPSDADLGDLLEAIVSGPSRQERGLGITTAVTAGTIGSVVAKRGIAEVDLKASFGEIRSADQLFALAQIVYTLTGQPGIGAVQFTLEGERIDVPLSEGNRTNGPLSRDDLQTVAPT